VLKHSIEIPGAPASNATPAKQAEQPTFPPLDKETREVVPTDCAAFHTNRRPQTLRAWACLENGPIRPLRINGRLGWRTADLRRLLGIEVAA
jgi:hypothetical protein